MTSDPEVTVVKILINLFSEGMQYLGYVIIALVGGFMNHLGKLRTGEIKRFRCIPLLIDISISGFAGLLVALLATSYDLRIEMVYFLSGISGHLGARGIFLLQSMLIKKLK